MTYLHTPARVRQQLVKDLKACAAEMMRDPAAPATGSAAIYGMSQSIPDRSLVGEIAGAFLDALYVARDAAPTNAH